jgi:hypothetical protein
MATALKLPTTPPRWARSPFYFNSAAHLLRIGREKAGTLTELLDAIRTCPESSIFQRVSTEAIVVRIASRGAGGLVKTGKPITANTSQLALAA